MAEDLSTRGLLGGSAINNPPAMQEMQEMQETLVPSPGQGDSLEKGMATHSSILAWRIPWTEEPGGRQSQTQLSNSHCVQSGRLSSPLGEVGFTRNRLGEAIEIKCLVGINTCERKKAVGLGGGRG